MPRISRGPSSGVVSHVVNRGNGRATVFHDEDDYAAFVGLLGEACDREPMRVVGCCLMSNHFHLLLWPPEEGNLSRWMQWLMTSHVRRHHRRYGTSGHVWQGRYKNFLVQPTRVAAEARLHGVAEGGDAVLAVLRYIERNPIRAGLSTTAEAWSWSSAHWWAVPASAPDFWDRRWQNRPEEWLRHVNRPQNEGYFEKFKFGYRVGFSLSGKEQKMVHMGSYSAVFCDAARERKDQRGRKVNFSRCPEDELAALRRCVQRGCPFGRERWVKQMARQYSLESTLQPRGRPQTHQEK